MISYLKELHEGWTPEIHYVLDSTPAEAVEQRDLYDRFGIDLLRRSWAEGPVVLVGDAVHPMMPNLGQGGCQSTEDGYRLGQELSTVQHTSEVSAALGRYSRVRVIRTAIIQVRVRVRVRVRITVRVRGPTLPPSSNRARYRVG